MNEDQARREPPVRLKTRLTALGHDVQVPSEEALSGAPDAQLWAATQAEGRFLITQDLDFSDARQFAPGTHHGLLLVRLREPTRRALLARVEGLFQQEDVSTWTQCFVVATDRKVRVRRPPR